MEIFVDIFNCGSLMPELFWLTKIKPANTKKS